MQGKLEEESSKLERENRSTLKSLLIKDNTKYFKRKPQEIFNSFMAARKFTPITNQSLNDLTMSTCV